MKVLIASTPDELSGQATLAARVVGSLSWVRQAHDPSGACSVEEGVMAVDGADLVLAFIGWRRGPLPGAIEGWDGETPWVAYELRRAFALHKPVLVMMADESWPQREQDPRSRALMADFRAELAPLAVAFGPDVEGDGQSDGDGFRAQLETELSRFRSQGRVSRSTSRTSRTSRSTQPGLTLRSWPPSPHPPEPWPLLLPYDHSDLLAGRERDLEALLAQLARPQPILGLHAVSGVGKSSLLAGGLVPRLRAEGRPVAFDRHPAEPGLAGRLIGDLLAGDLLDDTSQPLDLDFDLEHGDPEAFVELLLLARRLSGSPPVLVLDQVEELLRSDRRGRAVLGTLLAATVQRRPEVEDPPCRWLLAYRREAHGELVRWLGNALREARALGFGTAGSGVAEQLPHDLASHERFHAWPLAALGAVRSDDPDPQSAAIAAFRAVLENPLALVGEHGDPRYPWRFAGDGAERLADAFAAARRADREAPLVPELQVVLAHLMATAGPIPTDRPAALVVPEDPTTLIDAALEKHLARALDAAFPPTGDGLGDRVGRTRALLALHQLADAHGRRGAGRAGDALIRAIGQQGREVLEKLQAPGVRLVVASPAPDGGTVYLLSHDRLAEVVVAAVDGQGRLAVDRELLSLARLVALRSELFHGGERQTSTAVSAAQITAIERHAECLLVDREHREWWAACRDRRRRSRRRRLAIGSAIAALIAVAAWWVGSHFAARTEREALLVRVAQGEPEAAFAALGAALDDEEITATSILERLGERAAPLDVLESGMGGVPEPRRSRLVLEVAELALPLLHSAGPDDPVALASLVWALDHGPGRDPELAGRALEIRDAALAPLRERRPPPKPGADWVSVPAGSFRMGTEAGDGGDPEERPAHPVTVSAFRMLDHEVTNAELRRLDPSHEGADELPAALVTWYQAMLYAAWLGGRLPSEAEWEFAARADCAYKYCLADGTEAAVDDVAWTVQTASDGSGQPQPQPVRRLAPNPWGLFDIYGNLWEWTADWHAAYEASAQIDPRGPTGGRRRTARGGSFALPRASIRSALRFGFDPASDSEVRGLRPVLPWTEPPRADPPDSPSP